MLNSDASQIEADVLMYLLKNQTSPVMAIKIASYAKKTRLECLQKMSSMVVKEMSSSPDTPGVL